MTAPEDDELKKEIKFALSEDEEVRWAERRSYALDADVGVLLGAAVLLLGVCVFVTLPATQPEPPDYCNVYTISLSFLGAVALLLCALYGIKSHRRTIYALTQQRALIVQQPPIGKPIVYALPVSPDMVYRVTRHHDGRSDYNMAEMPLGRYGMRELGFLQVRDNEQLQAELSRCGVDLPPHGKQRPATRRVDAYSAFSPLLPMTGWLVLLGLMLAGVIRELSDSTTRTYLDLWLNGEKCSAAIIAYCHTTTWRTTTVNGKRREVSEKVVYYPVYRLTPADGTTIISTEVDGSSSIPKYRPGEQLTVYYDPLHTDRAMRRNADHFSIPLVFLGMGGVCVYMFLQAYRRYRHTRHQSCYLVTAEKVE